MQYAVIVRGKQHQWSIPVSEKQANAMEMDGFEVIEVHNSMPAWVQEAGLAGPWVFFQDLYDLPSKAIRWLKKGA